MYILSLPSFTWIKAFPTGNGTGPYPHGGCSANVVTKDQMLVIGGWFPDTNECDSNSVQGQHNMILGYNGEKKALWDKYDPNLSTYFVPTPIISAIGGGYVQGIWFTDMACTDQLADLLVALLRRHQLLGTIQICLYIMLSRPNLSHEQQHAHYRQAPVHLREARTKAELAQSLVVLLEVLRYSLLFFV